MAAIHINISPRHRQESQQRHHHARGLHGGREFSGWRLGLHRQQAGSGGLRLWPDAPAADEYRCRQGHAVADAERTGHTEQTAGDRLFGQRHGERGMPDHFGADRQRHLRERMQGAVSGGIGGLTAPMVQFGDGSQASATAFSPAMSNWRSPDSFV